MPDYEQIPFLDKSQADLWVRQWGSQFFAYNFDEKGTPQNVITNAEADTLLPSLVECLSAWNVLPSSINLESMKVYQKEGYNFNYLRDVVEIVTQLTDHLRFVAMGAPKENPFITPHRDFSLIRSIMPAHSYNYHIVTNAWEHYCKLAGVNNPPELYDVSPLNKLVAMHNSMLRSLEDDSNLMRDCARTNLVLVTRCLRETISYITIDTSGEIKIGTARADLIPDYEFKVKCFISALSMTVEEMMEKETTIDRDGFVFTKPTSFYDLATMDPAKFCTNYRLLLTGRLDPYVPVKQSSGERPNIEKATEAAFIGVDLGTPLQCKLSNANDDPLLRLAITLDEKNPRSKIELGEKQFTDRIFLALHALGTMVNCTFDRTSLRFVSPRRFFLEFSQAPVETRPTEVINYARSILNHGIDRDDDDDRRNWGRV